jgi:hypothetical protein
MNGQHNRQKQNHILNIINPLLNKPRFLTQVLCQIFVRIESFVNGRFWAVNSQPVTRHDLPELNISAVDPS